ncbi:rab5 GDP GTP exchange factor-like, partial [Brachionus plicatilis]
MSNKQGASSYTSPNHLYDTKTLLCKNKCGFYGNSMQYEGYCSICYRKLKTNKSSHSYPASMPSSTSFDDSTSLLRSSQSFSIDEKKFNNQYWNEHTNLSKFSAKSDKRKNSALNKIFRRPSSSTVYQNQHASLNLVDTMSKVADKAVNLVDQSLQSGISSLNTSSSFQFLASPSLGSENLLDFINIMNKLLRPSSPSSEINPCTILLSSTVSKTNSNKFAAQTTEDILKEFE